ncbi:MAG: tyrosine-type recombinase/integrase [Hyphomicrobiaceae bacterium]
MASLVKRNGVWHGRHIWRENGKRRERTKSLETGDQRLAFQRLAEWERELDATKHGEGYSPVFEEAARRWINAKATAVKGTTVTRYETSLRQLVPFFTGRRMMDLSPADLERFEAKRRRDPGRRLARSGERSVKAAKDNGHGKRKAQAFAPVSSASIRRDFACLSALMSHAVRMGWARENIVLSFLGADDKRTSLRASNARERYLSTAEEARLLAAAAQRKQGSEWDRRMFLAAVELAVLTGLRKEELLLLEWRNVQLGHRSQIAVRGKGDKVRRVPLVARGAEIVSGLPIPSSRGIGPQYVICRQDGRRYGSFDRALDEACRRAGLDDFTWHDLRRTCGCRLLQDKGLSLAQVRDWLGHSSVAVTEKHYAFLRVDDLHDAIDRHEQKVRQTPAATVVPLKRRAG